MRRRSPFARSSPRFPSPPRRARSVERRPGRLAVVPLAGVRRRLLDRWRARLAVFAVAAVASWLFLSPQRPARGARSRPAGPAAAHGAPERRPGRGRPRCSSCRWSASPGASWCWPSATLLSFFIGLAYAGNWESFLKWWYAVPFARTDPLFGHDLAFYVFTLPVWSAAARLGSARGLPRGGDRRRRVLGPRRHRGRARAAAAGAGAACGISRLLLAVFFLVKAGDYLLQRYDLLLSDNGVVFGAAYTDVHVRAAVADGAGRRCR